MYTGRVGATVKGHPFRTTLRVLEKIKRILTPDPQRTMADPAENSTDVPKSRQRAQARLRRHPRNVICAAA